MIHRSWFWTRLHSFILTNIHYAMTLIKKHSVSFYWHKKNVMRFYLCCWRTNTDVILRLASNGERKRRSVINSTFKALNFSLWHYLCTGGPRENEERYRNLYLLNLCIRVRLSNRKKHSHQEHFFEIY